MLAIRRSAERGHFDHGWLDTYHSFSFGDYYDPAHVGFRSLRVLNEDWVKPNRGFGKHGHKDMEIITYVLEGELTHGDSMGNGSVIRPGEVQRMSAGTGILHSELNQSETETVHLFQVWLLPERRGLAPGYEQRVFNPEEARNRWRVLASRDEREGSLLVHQDARVLLSHLDPGRSLRHKLDTGRNAWLQVARGEIVIDGRVLTAGDGAALSDVPSFDVAAQAKSELLLFDLA